MKIKSIAAICKKNKNIAIFERYSDDGDILTQYIGDGSAVYPVVGLPQLDKESLLTIFDVPEKDRDNYFVKTLGVPAGISFEDTDETERHVEREGISIIYSGRTLKPIRTTEGAEMQAFGMRFLRLGSGRSRTAAGVREGTRLDAMRRRLPAADYQEGERHGDTIQGMPALRRTS